MYKRFREHCLIKKYKPFSVNLIISASTLENTTSWFLVSLGLACDLFARCILRLHHKSCCCWVNLGNYSTYIISLWKSLKLFRCHVEEIKSSAFLRRVYTIHCMYTVYLLMLQWHWGFSLNLYLYSLVIQFLSHKIDISLNSINIEASKYCFKLF